MRFDLHYDDGPNGPRWFPIVVILIVATTLLLLALGDALIGTRG